MVIIKFKYDQYRILQSTVHYVVRSIYVLSTQCSRLKPSFTLHVSKNIFNIECHESLCLQHILTREDVVEGEEARTVAAVERNARAAEGGRLSAGGREDELERPLPGGPAYHTRVDLVDEHGARLAARAPATSTHI